MEYYPIIALVIFSTTTVGIITWKTSSFVSKTNAVISEWPGIKKTLNSLDKGMKVLNTLLIEKELIKESCYSSVDSPLEINDTGKRLFKESGADVLFESIKDILIKELEEQKLTTLLQLETNCLKLLIESKDQPEFKSLQDFAFQNPKFYDCDLSYTDILFVMSIPLRDYYRKKHPELDEQNGKTNENKKT